MPLSAIGRRRNYTINYWPSFVDALTTLLLVIIFLLSIFMLAQFVVSRELSGKDTALERLNSQIAELTQLLSLERASSSEQADQVATLQASLTDLETQRNALTNKLAGAVAGATGAGNEVTSLKSALTNEQQISRGALARVELLNQQLSALRRQIAALESALDASESRDKESQTRIADLGRRLNIALAQKVQELARFRSDFFGRLRQILADKANIQVVGDRFVLQSEVLFPTGSADLNPNGKQQLDVIAAQLKDLETQIPPDIKWILRVDGHTDARPIAPGGKFQNNWELSAARAIAVVRYLIDQGVSPDHLAAAGFGQYQPLVQGDTPEAYAKNRRIELKLTER